MHDVDRHDNVARHENDSVMSREPLAAEPLPVDESGLETGQDTARHTRPDHVPEQETAPDHDMDQTMDQTMVRGAVRDADTVPEGIPEAVPGAAQGRETASRQETELFTGDAVTRLRARWRELQADFVDDPERAVREADEVVDEVVRTITDHRQRLSGEWQGHTDTEHLRLAMREYRTFVDRLLPTT